MADHPELRKMFGKRFTEMNLKRNSEIRTCSYCNMIGKGPGFTNHINKCKRTIDSKDQERNTFRLV